MTTIQTLIERSHAITPYIIDLRREFHTHPELSLEEQRTSARVCEELEKLDIQVHKLADHCVVGVLQGAHPGKRLAIRADMDALPIEEENDLPYRSQTPGVMHACGHDGHTAMLLGAARMLAEIRDELHGTIFFCFQSAEEIGRGADVVVEFLESQGGVDEAIAAHFRSSIPSGQILVNTGPCMAAVDAFDITVTGKGGHGSRPDQCIDPIKPLAQMVLNIPSIPANHYDATDPLVIHIGRIEGGILRNIFPQIASLYGGMRFFTEEARKTAYHYIQKMAEHTAAMYGAQAEVKFLKGAPAIINDPGAVARAQNIIGQMPGVELAAPEIICASDNFSFFVEKYKGFMAFIGIRNQEKGVVYEHHHPKFDLDEDVMAHGALFFTLYAARFLEKE